MCRKQGEEAQMLSADADIVSEILFNMVLLKCDPLLMSRLSYSLLVQPLAASWLPATSVNCSQISFPSEMKWRMFIKRRVCRKFRCCVLQIPQKEGMSTTASISTTSCVLSPHPTQQLSVIVVSLIHYYSCLLIFRICLYCCIFHFRFR